MVDPWIFQGENKHQARGPMSPALFTIYSDILSRLLARAEQDGKKSGVKISRHSPKINHLIYALLYTTKLLIWRLWTSPITYKLTAIEISLPFNLVVMSVHNK